MAAILSQQLDVLSNEKCILSLYKLVGLHFVIICYIVDTTAPLVFDSKEYFMQLGPQLAITNVLYYSGKTLREHLEGQNKTCRVEPDPSGCLCRLKQ